MSLPLRNHWQFSYLAHFSEACIIIMGFRFTEEEHFANRYTLRNDETFTQFSDIIQVCTLELPKLKETDTGVLSDWMRFLAFEDEDELEVLPKRCMDEDSMGGVKSE
jgi:hypothetical protein